jgi:hypothetical protein
VTTAARQWPVRCAETLSYTDQACAPPETYLLPQLCCASCHEDEEHGYPLAQITVDGHPAEVCCKTVLFLSLTAARTLIG